MPGRGDEHQPLEGQKKQELFVAGGRGYVGRKPWVNNRPGGGYDECPGRNFVEEKAQKTYLLETTKWGLGGAQVSSWCGKITPK